MTRKLGVMAIVLPLLSFSQQPPNNLQPVSVGEQVPDVILSKISNYKTTTASLADFKGKILILDFWSTWCGSCIAAFPKIDELQKEWDDKIQILAITQEKAERVRGFIANSKKMANIKVPIITDDTVLSALFPYTMVPHVVWIDSTGKVQAITAGYYVTADNIREIVSSSKVGWPVKKDNAEYDSEKPLLVHGNGGAEDNFLYRSIITPYMPGLPSQLSINTNSDLNKIRAFATNMSIIGLYSLAFPSLSVLPANRLFLEVADKTKYQISEAMKKEEWYARNVFCYDLIVPAGDVNSARAVVQQDLDRFFKLKSGIEKRQLKCLVLVRTDSTIELSTTGGKPGTNFMEKGTNKYLQNLPLSSLVKYLNSLPGMPPVINEADFNSKVDMQLNTDLTDITALRKELQKYGLDLQNKNRWVEVMVLSEKQNH